MQAEPTSGGWYDVAILGGGPAGSATALALKRRDSSLRVALIEKSAYAKIRVGETLPPPAQRLLIGLGVWDAFLRSGPIESYGTRAAWGGPAFHEHEFIFSPFGRGWHVDRRVFDALLAGEAERAGVDVFRNATAHAGAREHDVWTLALHDGGARARDIRARFVVDATGRRCAFALIRGARRIVVDRLVGAAVFFRMDRRGPESDSYTWVEACRGGWWYTAALPDGHLAAMFMTDADLLGGAASLTLDRWSAMMAEAPHTARRVAAGTPIGPPALHAACSHRLDRCAGDGWIAVGDAASRFDPLSSLGVMKALRSGIAASHAICQGFLGHPHALDRYGAMVAKEYDAYLDARAAYYAMEPRWPDAPFWQRRRDAVTLDPRRRVRVVAADRGQARRAQIAARLSTAELVRLTELCAEPRAACDVVRAFKVRAAHKYPDRQVVLAIQDLIAGGVLEETSGA